MMSSCPEQRFRSCISLPFSVILEKYWYIFSLPAAVLLYRKQYVTHSLKNICGVYCKPFRCAKKWKTTTLSNVTIHYHNTISHTTELKLCVSWPAMLFSSSEPSTSNLPTVPAFHKFAIATGETRLGTAYFCCHLVDILSMRKTALHYYHNVA